MTDPIRLGTRASLLARTQSTTVGDALSASSGRAWVEVLVRTAGDDPDKPLDRPGSPGLFVSALRQALHAGEVDVIVHSFKDLPSEPEPGIVLAAVPARVDPRDALVSRNGVGLHDLPAGSVIGTSSPRRAATIARLRPDLVTRPIRGNVDTRIRKVREGEFDATVLAVAGLTRIRRTDAITEILDDMLPAPAQGALAIECREGDVAMRSLLAVLDNAESRLVTAAERHVLVGISAACTTAIAALATHASGRLRLRAELTVDGRHLTADLEAPCEPGDLAAARVLGLRVAGVLSGSDRPVLLIRSQGNQSDAASLSGLGIASISEPYVRIAPLRDGRGAFTILKSIEACATDPLLAARTWLVATSPMTVPSWLAATGGAALRRAVAGAAAAGLRAAATGDRTAATLRDLGFGEVMVPADPSAQGLVDDLTTVPAGRAVFPCGNLALRTLPDGLRALGWVVDEGVVYETATVGERPASAELVERREVSAIVLRSPSAVRALVAHARVPDGLPVICAGRTTAAAAHEAGLTVASTAASPSAADVAEAVARIVGRTRSEEHQVSTSSPRATSLAAMHLILIPGLWLDGSSWDDVVPVLEREGHRTHPLTLPGMESAGADRSQITLRDHVAAVVAAIDSTSPGDGDVVLVGHSGGGAIAHAAVDARPDRVARVVYVDCVPVGDGAVINDQLPVEHGEIPLPDWSTFDEEDLIDLDDRLRAMFRARAIPSPAHVASDPQRLVDERRYGVPVTVVACEFTSAMLREWMAQGAPFAQELSRIRRVDYLDVPTGHWPQFTRPHELAQAILTATSRTALPD